MRAIVGEASAPVLVVVSLGLLARWLGLRPLAESAERP